jgi:hypothetical protein
MYAESALGPPEEAFFFVGFILAFSGLEATAASKRACRGGVAM